MTDLPQDILRDYATGATSPGVALLVSSQMTRAPRHRATLADYESVAGALFADEDPAPLGEDLLAETLARIGQEPEPGPRDAPDPGPLPAPLITAVGRDFDTIPWRFCLPGVSEHRLKGFGEEQVSLLRARPGVAIPQHTHEGREVTLVLTGALQDGHTVFGPGDVSINDEDDDHKPRIVGTEICHCLIVMSGALRFTGRFGRALNLLAE